MGKPRQTQRDKWQKRPVVMRYRAFADELRLRCKTANFELGDILDAVFIIPMPKSWSKKKRFEMDGKPHQQKPDIDNIEKAIQDALCPEDSHIYKHRTVKVWGQKGQIIFRS
jgi:Holliday junction resolvase RusA-like endonuclease